MKKSGHPKFVRAATGRMACDQPNLQNIPRAGPLRNYIRAPEGRMFVIADYPQIEFRIAIKISGDAEMLAAPMVPIAVGVTLMRYRLYDIAILISC